LAEDGGFELLPAYLHTNTLSYLGQLFAAFKPMFVGASKTHVSWIPKFPAHESAHGLSRGALTLWITPAVVPNLRDSPVCGNFVDTFLETKIRILQRMQGPLTRPIQKSGFSNCSKLEGHAQTVEGEEMSGKDEWMRLADVAAESKMALSTIYYLHNKGRGPKFSRLGRTVRVKRSDFDAWFEENREN
jgi:predicted DNA-binding transcriptional regulator AlpA